jgi:hypothetical protein
MTEKGPASARVLLGRELRELRETAGLDHKAVAAGVGWPVPKIYRSETGIGALRANEIDQLLELYGADDDTSGRIRAVAGQARMRNSYGKVPDWSRQYLGLEQEATDLSFYQGELIPGLFQTEGYARALISTSKTVAPADVDEVVRARVRRHALLERDHAPAVHLVLGEATIRQAVGGPDIQAGQLERLIETAQLPHVTVQILPFTVGAHAALGNPFVLLTLDIGGRATRWVYIDDLTRGECRVDATQVRAHQLTFDSLAVNALGEGETLRLLKKSRDDLR